MKGSLLSPSKETKLEEIKLLADQEVLVAELPDKMNPQRPFVFSAPEAQVQFVKKYESQSLHFFTRPENIKGPGERIQIFSAKKGMESHNQSTFERNGAKENKDKIGVCGVCKETKMLSYTCPCQKVHYCSLLCKSKDYIHERTCEKEPTLPRKAGESLRAKKGLIGLENLGNTCFMNSGIQCLSHTMELTEFFLSNEYSKEINEDNPIGTQGKLVKAYASLMDHLWFGSGSSFRPYQFKKALGSANPMVSSLI